MPRDGRRHRRASDDDARCDERARRRARARAGWVEKIFPAPASVRGAVTRSAEDSASRGCRLGKLGDRRAHRIARCDRRERGVGKGAVLAAALAVGAFARWTRIRGGGSVVDRWIRADFNLRPRCSS